MKEDTSIRTKVLETNPSPSDWEIRARHSARGRFPHPELVRALGKELSSFPKLARTSPLLESGEEHRRNRRALPLCYTDHLGTSVPVPGRLLLTVSRIPVNQEHVRAACEGLRAFLDRGQRLAAALRFGPVEEKSGTNGFFCAALRDHGWRLDCIQSQRGFHGRFVGRIRGF